MFLDNQKTQWSIYFKTRGQDFQTISQKIGWDFEVVKGNQKLRAMFGKFSHMFGL